MRQHKNPTESALSKIVKKFQETSSVIDEKSLVLSENIATVYENVVDNPSFGSNYE